MGGYETIRGETARLYKQNSLSVGRIKALTKSEIFSEKDARKSRKSGHDGGRWMEELMNCAADISQDRMKV